jgi:arabinofuranan 3-O-arabinosyltransferase
VAVVAYLPLFATRRGLLTDDTKIYLYLDPAHLIATAASMWNSDVGFGTVTHQNIGYLLPMGPYYWATKALGVPEWMAQRFWLGSLLFLAALGVRKCAQELGLTRWAGWYAAVPYMLTPYILVNLDRTSAILMPWAGLGWMMVFTIRAARRNDYRNPALFALVVALVGGVNATSILMVGFAPLLYLLFAARTGEIPWRRCWWVMVRIGILSLLVSIWWIAGLWAEGKYGINILRFTESFVTVTYTSTSSEVFRGLGYWYFYGRDALQPWTLSSLSYVTGRIVPTASFVVPLVGFVAALCTRWRYRLFAAATAFVGVVVAVGAYPIQQPPPFGFVFKFLALHTTAALAMRSSNRVVPIVVLGLALLTAAGAQAARQRRPRLSLVGGAVFLAVVGVGLLPLFEGHALSTNLSFPDRLPAYVTRAAHALDQGPSTSSVLGLPGEDFAYYRYGTAGDSVWPGITDRPWISSQVQLAGEPASINLVRGLDSTLQNGVADPSSIAPIARLLDAGNVLVQMDQQYERFNSPLPSYMWNLVHPMPRGLRLVKVYGPRTTFQAVDGPYIDEAILGLPIGYQFPRSLAILKVAHPRTLVRTESRAAPQIVAGDGEGLVTMAETRLLDSQRAILFDGSSTRAEVRAAARQPGAWLVLTDSNQRRLDSYGTLGSTEGYVEQAHEVPLVGASGEESLPTFPHPPKGSQTVALMKGLARVGASGYGNVITNNPEDQPFEAVDGNIYTAWEVSAFSPAIGQFFQMTASRPHVIHHLLIVQPQSVTQNRTITSIGISIDGGPQVVRSLGRASTTPTGQVVTIPRTRGRTIRLTILDDSDHDLHLPQASGVGFAEVDVHGFGPATRGLLLPTSLLKAAGAAAATDRLSIVTNRLRAATVPPRIDAELALLRYFDLPYAREFRVGGLANLNPAASDDLIDRLVGRHPGTGVSIKSAESSSRLTGSLNNMAWDAFDDNPSTAWESRFHVGPGEWLREQLTQPITLSTFKVTVINDGYHMIPTAMSVSNGTTTEQFALPISMASPTGHLNTEQSFTVNVPPLTGSTFTYTITKIKVVQVIDRVNGGPNYPSFAIADIDVPGVTPGVTPPHFDTGCRTDLLSVDGHPVPIRVTGSTAHALDQGEMSFATCTAADVSVPEGRDVIASEAGAVSGVNINNVVLTSTGTIAGPPVAVESRPASWYGRTVVRSTVGPTDAGRWLVLAQSYANGWHAYIGGHDLGRPTLIDGASMGWRLPRHIDGTQSVAFVWKPQQVIFLSLLLSGAALLLTLYLAITDRPRRRRVLGAYEQPADATPELTWSADPAIARPRVLYATALLVALAVSPFAVPPLLGATWLWLRRRRFGWGLMAGAVTLALAGVVITVHATQGSIQRDISWPSHVDYANTAMWLALGLWMLAIVGTTLARSRGDAPAQPVPTPVAPDIATEPPAITDAAPIAPLPAPRRRGLNIPVTVEPAETNTLREITTIPLGGLSRSLFLLRTVLKNRHQPEEWQSILTEDSINQIVGKTPIFNRRVLDISDSSATHAMVLIERGAHVTTMRRQAPATRRSHAAHVASSGVEGELEFTPNHIPAPDFQFDLVFATNVLSCVPDPARLLDELVRVTRVGGTIYIQNVMWNSLLGGRETSPWHLVSGGLARRHYARRHGQEPFNRFGVNFFKLTPRRLMRLLRRRRDIAIYLAGPRFLPMKWGWTLRVPILRNLVIQDLVVAVERR